MLTHARTETGLAWSGYHGTSLGNSGEGEWNTAAPFEIRATSPFPISDLDFLFLSASGTLFLP